MTRMIAIIDTNIIFSALYKPDSNPGLILLLAILDRIELVAPLAVRREIREKLVGKLRFGDQEALYIISALPIRWVEDEIVQDLIPRAQNIIADRDDAPIVALQILTGYPIITGDNELLENKNIHAYSPRDFLETLVKNNIVNRKEIEELKKEIKLIEALVKMSVEHISTRQTDFLR